MQTYENWTIQEIPLRSPFFRDKVERFLGANGLRMESLDLYYALQDADGQILAGAGLSGDVLKCIAVSPEARSGGLVAPLVSAVISAAAARGITTLKVFTKPSNEAVFASLGFHTLAAAPCAILMENGRGLEQYCADLCRLRRPGRCGVVVMNANPFTLGHRYLIDRALAQVDTLFVIPVKEDVSAFSYSERLDMILRGCLPGSDRSSQNLVICDGSAYQISALTFPTYFLKDLSEAAETQMLLDLDLFGRHIAPALGATVRFAGSEPADPLTARYNALMQAHLPSYGLSFVEIPRLETPALAGDDGLSASEPVSASAVRSHLAAGHFAAAAALTPASSHPFLLAYLADRALRLELDTPHKPGLVGPDSQGAHKDMDYALMLRALTALRPFWTRMALAATPCELRSLGLDAERAMLAATGGVNTHRGAIFALGLALNAASHLPLPCGSTALSGFPSSSAHDPLGAPSCRCEAVEAPKQREMEVSDNQEIMQKCLVEIAYSLLHKCLSDNQLHLTGPSHGEAAVKEYGVKGARQMAEEGYRMLFEDWLPFYRASGRSPLATLLRIMATLDDTCILHRVGYARSQEVKREAEALLETIPVPPPGDGAGWTGPLKEMCDRYAAEGISPGGAADMLALTIFTDAIL